MFDDFVRYYKLILMREFCVDKSAFLWYNWHTNGTSVRDDSDIAHKALSFFKTPKRTGVRKGQY